MGDLKVPAQAPMVTPTKEPQVCKLPPESLSLPPTGSLSKGDQFQSSGTEVPHQPPPTIKLFGEDEKPPVPKTSTPERDVTKRKGQVSFGWGYGVQHYAPSDVRFQGANHDFTLKAVKAYDRPSPLKTWDDLGTYVNPAKLSIPQYMLDIDYYVTDDIFIRAGQHHMKWVMDDNQMVQIEGKIGEAEGAPYAGTYNGEFIDPNQVVQKLEHTDGLNDVHVGVGAVKTLWQPKNKRQALSFTSGVTAGVVVPKTDARVFEMGKNHQFKPAGYSLSGMAGLRYEVNPFRHWKGAIYCEGVLNGGHINLTNFTTTGRPGDKGSQKINYLNEYVKVGVNIPLGKSKE